MKIIKGFAIISAFLAAGELFSVLIGHFMPGSVIGMLLLFAALCLGLVKAESIRQVAVFLTDNMTIFFIPAFVGIMEQWGWIRTSLAGWLAVVLTTLVVMAASGHTAQLVSHLRKGGGR